MNRRLFALGSIICLVVLSPITASAQQAALITAVGWWSQRPGAAELPDGGFEVALFPNGPVSQAALRVDVTTPLSSALLELTESEQVLGDVARILACPTSDTWTPANPGTWADAPAANCDDASVALGRSATGTWTGDVTSLLRGGMSSVALVPFSELSETQQSATFQVVFSKARLTASAPSTPFPATGTPTPVYAPPPPVAPQIPSGPVGLFPAPVAPAPTPPTDLYAASAEPFDSAAGDEDPTEPKPWWRLLFGIPLSAVAGVGAVFVRRILQRRGLGFES